MKIDGNTIKPGHILNHKGRLWHVVKTQHTQPGKGGAYMQVELRDIRGETKLNERFRSSESVERVRLEEVSYQFLYPEGEQLTLMHPETFEQISLSQKLVGDQAVFLQDGMLLNVCSYEGDIVSVSLPSDIVMEVVEAEPVVKGQTASSSYKPAILENGVRILVPPHINAGTKIVVDIQERTYKGRPED